MSVLLRGVGKSPGGSIFSPLDLSSLTAWYSAQRQTGYTNGAAVTSATDFSGNGRTLVNSTVASQPAFSTGGINNRPSFTFTVDVLRYSFGSSLSQPFTMAGVAIATLAADTRMIDGGDGNLNRCVVYVDAGNHRMFAGVVSSAEAVSTGAAFKFVAVFNGANSRYYINNTAFVATSPGAQGIDRITFGADQAEVSPWAGEIGEYLIYSAALSSAQCEQLKDYFNAQWGL